MLEVIVIEKDTLQVVNDHIAAAVGGISNLTVIGATGCSDADMNMGLFKAWGADLCLLGDGLVDHPDSVFFQGTCQFLQFRYHQADHLIRISLGDRPFPNDPFTFIRKHILCSIETEDFSTPAEHSITSSRQQ